QSNVNTIKGTGRLVANNNSVTSITFNVLGAVKVGGSGGYYNVTIANAVGSPLNPGSPFSNGDSMTLFFNRAGDRGRPGGDSAVFTWVGTTGGANPGVGCAGMSISAPASGIAYIDMNLTDYNGATITPWLQGFRQGSRLRLTQIGNPAVWGDYQINVVGIGASYASLQVTPLAGSSTFFG